MRLKSIILRRVKGTKNLAPHQDGLQKIFNCLDTLILDYLLTSVK
nr:MAG TPA: hypothetical protein [Caudoviricetes sp.]